MTTAAQVAANRSNAQHSTGPRTAQGKARCAHNALTHGLRSHEAVLDSEWREEFEEFAGALRAELRPASEWEGVLADRVIFHAWRLRRAARLETSVLDHALAPAGKRDAEWRDRLWDRARQKAKERGEDPAVVAEPRPRAWPGERDPYFLGEALVETLGAHSPLDVLRRYERTSERAMYDAMRQLQAARKLRAENGQQAAAGEATPEALQENCQTDPIPGCHGPTSSGDRALTCGEAALECGDVRGTALDGMAAASEALAQTSCQTDPIPPEVPASAGLAQRAGEAGTASSTQSQPEASTEARGQSGPAAANAAQPEAAVEAVEESCQTDPIAQRERRIAAFRARQRAMREEERRMGVPASEGTGMQAVI
jgi:hypothetical protein